MYIYPKTILNENLNIELTSITSEVEFKNYTYLLEQINAKEHEPYLYIGARGSGKAISADVKYWSSSDYVKIAVENGAIFNKYILNVFETRLEATKDEIYLHNKFDVAGNPIFYNKSKQNTTGFTTAGLTGIVHFYNKITNSLKYIKKDDEKQFLLENPNYVKDGLPMTNEQKKNISGKNNPNFGVTGANHFNTGKKRTKKQKANISGENHWSFGLSGDANPNYGKKRTAEQNKKNSERMSGKNNPNFGIKWTEERKRKLSESRKGKNNSRAKAVVCIETGQIFGAGTLAAKWANIKPYTMWYRIKNNITKNGYTFKYLK